MLSETPIELFDFLSLRDANVRYVVLSVMFLSISSGLIGVWLYLRKMALVGETVAHSMLPGIALAFIITGTKDIVLLAIGAILSGWLSLKAIQMFQKRGIIKPDLSLAVVLSGFFAIGIALLTYIQNADYSDHGGLDHYIFGRAAALHVHDMWVFSSLAVLVLIAIVPLIPVLGAFTFNSEFLKAGGLPVKALEILLNMLTVLVVALGIKAVGIILMASMTLIPAACARYWTSRLKPMLLLSVLIGLVGAIGGAYVSYRFIQIPTGPVTVVILAILTLFSTWFAPDKGLAARWFRNISKHRIIETEDFLRNVHTWAERRSQLNEAIIGEDIRRAFGWSKRHYYKRLRWGTTLAWCYPTLGGLKLTQRGRDKGKKINELHRIWEIYLAKKLNMRMDQIHHTADVVEHILTPEIEMEIRRELEVCDNFSPAFEIHEKSVQ